MVEFPDKNICLYSEGIDFGKDIKSLSNYDKLKVIFITIYLKLYIR